MTDRIENPWGERTPYGAGERWPDRVDTHLHQDRPGAGARRRRTRAWVEIHPADAARLGIADGDLVEVASRRGAVRVPARLGGVRPGVVFLPFHYGYFDVDPDKHVPRAANELTLTACDPVSKQPIYKVAAVKVSAVRGQP